MKPLQRVHASTFLGLALLLTTFAQAAPVTGTIQPTPTPAATATPIPTPKAPPKPPQAQAYVRVQPGAKVVSGHTLVPASFLQNTLGAAINTTTKNSWKITFFSHTIEVSAGEEKAIFDGHTVELPIAPRVTGGHLYLPWVPVAKLFGFKWSRVEGQPVSANTTVLLLQYPAAYIENIRHSATGNKIRVVMDLSNATRVTARYTPSGVTIYLAAARKAGIEGVEKVGDILVPRVTTQSGNWKSQTAIKLNYAAPATWFTTSNPPRIVVDVQKIFERKSTENISTGLALTKIFRGTNHGPVRMWVARFDPDNGWRVRVALAGFGVLQRQRTSRIASRYKAPLAINGGFFAFDGAAVGAVKINGEWIRLPWKGRTAIGFDKKGKARIDNLQARAEVSFSSGLKLPIRDLNGWPDKNRITAITRRFAPSFKLRPGDIATIVDNGVVTSTPGSGKVNVPAKGFVLVANGGAMPELQKARKGLKATLNISAPGWEEYSSALGGGPRLVTNGKADVKEEGFRSDVTNGLGPRTAMGIDKQGRYILLVADGRRPNYSTGLTLQELAYTLQKHGAVDALNLDGGGSTSLVVRGRVVNRPSDGSERRVSNALLVMR